MSRLLPLPILFPTLLSLGLAACADPAEPPPVFPRAELRFPAGPEAVDPMRGAALSRLRFRLEAQDLRPYAELILDGAWWAVTATVNGRRLPEATTGVGPLVLPLDGGLREGWNTLLLEARAPSEEPALLSAGRRRRVGAGVEARILLLPERRVEALALPMEGREVSPLVSFRGAPEGSRARLVVTLDGRLIQRWPEIPVQDDLARFPSARWKGPIWDPGRRGDAGLVVATAMLLHGEDLLDSMSVVTGARDFRATEGGFRLNGRHSPLLAVRVDPARPLAPQAWELPSGGVNALELHASEAGDSWLSALDELGLPLVVMPRCDGQIWVGDETSRGERLAALGSKLASQDERLVRALAHHPAPLLWVCEGSPETAAALCAPLARDPLRRPVAGLDLAVDVAPRSRKGADGERVWVAEIAGGPAGGTGTIATAAAEFLEQTRKGGFGGVILPPPAMRLFPKEWPKAWSGVASGLEARPWTAIERRASSRVGMEGLEAGRVAWIEVPYQQPVGLVAPSGGGGETWIWHTGAARLRQEGVSREITLRPASWRGLQRE